MHFRKVDTDGLFAEDVIQDAVPMLKDGTPDPLYITVPVPQDSGFQRARFNFETEAWEEGGTPPALVTPEPTPEERLAAVEAQTIEQADAIATIYELMLGGGLGA